MKKLIIYFVLIMVAVAFAVPNGYFLRNSDGTIDMIASKVVLSGGAVINGDVTYVSSVTFTNGWSIQCTTNGLEFVSP